jgi:hypothetical protein
VLSRARIEILHATMNAGFRTSNGAYLTPWMRSFGLLVYTGVCLSELCTGFYSHTHFITSRFSTTSSQFHNECQFDIRGHRVHHR